MRWLLLALLVVHGLIHFMGVAQAFGLAELEALTQPVSRGMGVVWLVAGLGFLAAAFLLVRAPAFWWAVAVAAVALSEMAIVSAWSDARFGTVVNLLVLVVAVHAAASVGPWSFRARYQAAVEDGLAALAGQASAPPGAALETLPEPVRRYLAVTGAAERPVPTWFRAMWRGRIRGGPEEPWMEFTAEQHNFLDGPSRFFIMDARRGGLPVDVLHVYRAGTATMQVRLLSLIPLVDARGAEMDRAETVTVLNDMAILAPGALLDPAIRWEPVDARTVRARYAVGDQAVSATLHFDETGELVDFVSDDRMAARPDGDGFEPMRWSTPVAAYRNFGGLRAPTRGVGLWHPEDGTPWPYFEGEILELEVGSGPPSSARASGAARAVGAGSGP